MNAEEIATELHPLVDNMPGPHPPPWPALTEHARTALAGEVRTLGDRLAAAEDLLLLADRCHRQHPQAFFLTAAGDGRAAGEKFVDELRAWKRGRKEG